MSNLPISNPNPTVQNLIYKILVSKKAFNKNIHNISVKENIGIGKLTNTIVKHLKSLAPKQNVLLTRKRHIDAIKRSIDVLNDAQKSDLNIYPEIVSENLRIVAKEIGNITNIIDVEEILDDIFSSFCIGK